MRLGTFPAAARDVVGRIVTDARAPAFLQVDPDGALVASGGDAARYGLAEFAAGDLAEDCFDLLMGLLPATEDPLKLPAVETPSGVQADLYVAHHEGFDWVLFFDVSEDVAHDARVQQLAYDEALQASALSRTVDRFVGRQMAQAIERITGAGAERRTVTILFADLCGFTDMSAKSQPHEVFEVLNAYLDPMLGAILANEGVVDKIIGDAVMGIFGFAEDDPEAPRHAVDAARAIRVAVDGVHASNVVRRMDVAIGVATGEVVIGVLGHATRRTITVIGHAVNLAARLQSAAGPTEVIINQRTRDGIPKGAERFQQIALKLKGLKGETAAYKLVG